MIRTTALVIVAALFGYMMAPQLAVAAKYATSYVVPAGVSKLTLKSTYKGQVVIERTISVKPGQRFIVRAAS